MATSNICHRCGRTLSPSARFCPGCGASVQQPPALMATGLLSANHMIRGRYMIVHKLAQGGQSAVYLAIDTRDGQQKRAIKEMSEATLSPSEREHAIRDFLREAQMLSHLEHPALARVYDTFVEAQKHYLVMEYVPGHNLEDELVMTGRPLEWQRVVEWGAVLCDVLGYLHRQNPPIVYRDLKPANVMLTPQGTIKLIDFGIARWLHPNRSHDTSLLGTDGYAPLEQYSGRSVPRSDQYALGASLYHLLTGRVPEAAPLRMAGQPLTPIRAINPSVPEIVERIVLQALNLHAGDRFPDADRMRAALQMTRRATGAPRPRHTQAPVPSPTSRPSDRPATPPAGFRATSGPSAQAPHLSVWPLRLDAGVLEPGQSVTLSLNVSNRGGGELTGRIDTNLPCLAVRPPQLDRMVSQVQVQVVALGLPPGFYTGHVSIRSSGGAQIVPIRFVVRPAGNNTATSGRGERA